MAKPIWRATVDQKTGKTYYYHRKTRQVQWDKPSDFDETVNHDKKKKEHHQVAAKPLTKPQQTEVEKEPKEVTVVEPQQVQTEMETEPQQAQATSIETTASLQQDVTTSNEPLQDFSKALEESSPLFTPPSPNKRRQVEKNDFLAGLEAADPMDVLNCLRSVDDQPDSGEAKASTAMDEEEQEDRKPAAKPAPIQKAAAAAPEEEENHFVHFPDDDSDSERNDKLQPREKSVSQAPNSATPKESMIAVGNQVTLSNELKEKKPDASSVLESFFEMGQSSQSLIGKKTESSIKPQLLDQSLPLVGQKKSRTQGQPSVSMKKSVHEDKTQTKKKKSAQKDDDDDDNEREHAMDLLHDDARPNKPKKRKRVTRQRSLDDSIEKEVVEEEVVRRRPARAAAELANVALRFVHGRPPSPTTTLPKTKKKKAHSPGPYSGTKPSSKKETKVKSSTTQKTQKKQAEQSSRALEQMLERDERTTVSDIVLHTTKVIGECLKKLPWVWPISVSADNHTGVVTDSLLQFAQDVIVPSMEDNLGRGTKNASPVIVATCILLREVVMQNAMSIFGEDGLSDLAEGDPVSGLFASSNLATSVILSALEKLEGGSLVNKFMSTMDAYDDGDEEFATVLDLAERSDSAVGPDGQELDDGEQEMWLKSYSLRAENHPVRLKQRLRFSDGAEPLEGVMAVAPANAVHVTKIGSQPVSSPA